MFNGKINDMKTLTALCLWLKGTITHKAEGGRKNKGQRQRKEWYQGGRQGERTGQSEEAPQCFHWQQQQQVCSMKLLFFFPLFILWSSSASSSSVLSCIAITCVFLYIYNEQIQIQLYFKQQLWFQLRVIKWIQLILFQSLWFLQLAFILLFQLLWLPEPQPQTPWQPPTLTLSVIDFSFLGQSFACLFHNFLNQGEFNLCYVCGCSVPRLRRGEMIRNEGKEAQVPNQLKFIWGGWPGMSPRSAHS